MHFTDDGVYTGQQIILYPAYDSGADPVNNYQPVRITKEQALPVWEAIQYDTEWTLPSLQEDEYGRAFAIMDYLPVENSPEEETEPEKQMNQTAPSRSGKALNVLQGIKAGKPGRYTHIRARLPRFCWSVFRGKY